ncbi:response regulator [Desulfatitalea alkaliphila]|uniref:Response regulator n=1 Tax=Desulfatitalea alkaliphila TaxID=2929485 RepID=A0AA41R850_9BACT|nr:response regulator [Desulfatitalea alkaliphila]MCJ8502751.1 response regulator [Desulfatitalea alkaliphila]
MQPLVMVVDDEEKVRKYLSRLLQKRGFTVETAADGEAALALLAERDFDVVLLDVLMPGLDGIAVLKEIKQRRPLTEVIILTGNASVNTGVAGLQHGAVDYLLKPVNLDNLMVCMGEALEQRRFRQSQPPHRPQKGG